MTEIDTVESIHIATIGMLNLRLQLIDELLGHLVLANDSGDTTAVDMYASEIHFVIELNNSNLTDRWSMNLDAARAGIPLNGQIGRI